MAELNAHALLCSQLNLEHIKQFSEAALKCTHLPPCVYVAGH